MRRFRRASATVAAATVLGLAQGCSNTHDDQPGDTLRVVGPFEIHSLEPTATRWVTHDRDLAGAVADRVLELPDALVQTGSRPTAWASSPK